MNTHTLHTVIVKGADNKWHDWNFHGAFEDAARDEAIKMKSSGVRVALRFDTYRRNAKTPHATRLELV